MLSRNSLPRVLCAGMLSVFGASAAVAQQGSTEVRRLTRQEAITAALGRGLRVATARADVSAAMAGEAAARAIPNPVLTSEYTKDTPQYHLSMEWPIDLPWQRARRIGSATALRSAARYRLMFEQAGASLDADTTYTHALVARAKADLSRGNAAAADTLLRFARARQQAGDAAELEVRIAEIFAGQQANLAASDSVELDSRLLDLQLVMGEPGDQVAITLADSLGDPPATDAVAANGPTLLLAAAQQLLHATELAVRLERSSVWQAPSLVTGFDTHDPGGQRGALPVLGLSLPLPLLNRNRGGIALAEAERERAQAQLSLVRVETSLELARVRRERRGALTRLDRDRALLVSADRVASMSLTAYREGAATLASVLEAQRNARDVRAQYLDDLAAAWITAGRERALSLTAPDQPLP
ncbi:MAG: TolC family protein [Gemmatimonadaceae bacterium]